MTNHELVLTASELPTEIATRLADQSVDPQDRLALARTLVAEYGEVSILLSKSGMVDGNGFDDEFMPSDQLRAFAAELGFPEKRYIQESNYEWHTNSIKNPDLIIQVKEGPVEIGAETDLFPDGKAWSQYDHINTVTLLVFPTLPKPAYPVL